MSHSPRELLRHILDEIEYLQTHSQDLTFEQFEKDATLIRAFARSLEIIGEATKKLPLEFRDKHPDIEWKGMAGLRDKLIHDYFGVDYELVWDIIVNKIPFLNGQIHPLIEE